jgi:hypothetical protein
MVKQYVKAPAYMGKYLEIKGKRIEDSDVLTGNYEQYVKLGMLKVKEGESAPPAPAKAPAPAPAREKPPKEAPSGITKSPAAKFAEQQKEAFSGSAKPRQEEPPEKAEEPKKEAAPAKKTPAKAPKEEPPKKKAKKKAPKRGGKKRGS